MKGHPLLAPELRGQTCTMGQEPSAVPGTRREQQSQSPLHRTNYSSAVRLLYSNHHWAGTLQMRRFPDKEIGANYFRGTYCEQLARLGFPPHPGLFPCMFYTFTKGGGARGNHGTSLTQPAFLTPASKAPAPCRKHCSVAPSTTETREAHTDPQPGGLPDAPRSFPTAVKWASLA